MSSARPSFNTKPARRGRCSERVWLRVPFTTDAKGIAHAKLKLANPLGPGSYVAYSRATTAAGAAETQFAARRNRIAFTTR